MVITLVANVPQVVVVTPAPAEVTLTLTSTATTTATTADAVGLRIDGSLRLAGGLPTALGSVVLAHTACTAGTADPPVGSVTSITPNTGPVTGGTATTITGVGFTGCTGATFGGTAGTSFVVVNDTTITVTTPAHAAGAVDVVVLCPSGNLTLVTGFTFTGVGIPPTVTSITPTFGPTTGGTLTTITGTNFTGCTGVTFDGAAGIGFVVVSSTTITVITPAGAFGPANIVISCPTGVASLLNGFTYVAPTPLPATGSQTTLLLTISGLLVLAGLASRRIARRAPIQIG